MSENSHRDSRETTSAHRPRAFYTSLYGGLVVGILDLVFAFTFYGLIMGAKPMRIFQGVAAGVLGRPKAIEGGVPTLLLGIPASFCGCDMRSHRLLPCNSGAADLIRHPIISGLSYGLIAYFGMKYIVLPLSAIGQRGTLPRLPIFLTEVIGHVFLVGLPLALLARRFAEGIREPAETRATSGYRF